MVTGATSITSTAFVGGLTGNVTGNASGTALTVTQAAQSAITSLGTLTALTVDNMAMNGNTLTTTSADYVIDASHDIILDADGSDIRFKDGGTLFGLVSSGASDNFIIQSAVSDKDIIVKGNDGGSTITALTLDMSAAGAAHFTGQVGIGVAPSAGTAMLTLAADGSGSTQAGIDFDDTNSGDGYRLYANAGNFYIRNYDDGQTDVQVTAGGDTTIARGDLIFGTAGKGVVLGATSNTDANTLDDYEEGSFTPVFSGSSGSTGSYNTGEHEARYTKIGRLVTLHFKITLSNKGSWGGEVRFTTLPFTPSFTLNGAGSVELGNVNYTGDSVGNINTYITASQTYWRMRYTKDNEAAVMVQVSEVDNDAFFGGTVSYITTA